MIGQSRRQFLGSAVVAAGAQGKPPATVKPAKPGAASIRIPVRVNHGNAAAPVGAGHQGYDCSAHSAGLSDACRPPQIIGFASGRRQGGHLARLA